MVASDDQSQSSVVRLVQTSYDTVPEGSRKRWGDALVRAVIFCAFHYRSQGSFQQYLNWLYANTTNAWLRRHRLTPREIAFWQQHIDEMRALVGAGALPLIKDVRKPTPEKFMVLWHQALLDIEIFNLTKADNEVTVETFNLLPQPQVSMKFIRVISLPLGLHFA